MKFIYVFLLCVVLFACKEKSTGNTDKAKTEAETVDKSGPEYTSKYTCPMHCKGSGSATEGKCPVCGMDYVLTEVEEKK